MLKLLRRSLAAIVFIAFLCAFQDVGGMALVRLSGWQIIPALLALNGVALLVLFGVTVLLGRVYCSVFCPLGVLQDVIMGVASLCGRRRVAVYAPPMNKTRWAVFAVCLICVLAGLTALPALIFPYSAFGRIASQLFVPVATLAGNLTATLLDALDLPILMKQEIFVKGAMALCVAAASLILLCVATVLKGRWFCNALCPAGTLLSVLSLRPVFRLKIDESKCVKCGLCEKQCKTGCIDATSGKLDNARCVRCMNCISTCAKGAVKWRV